MSVSRVPGAGTRARQRPPAETARRLVATLPLAALVAMLAHMVAFGTAHAPGGDHAFELVAAVTLGLGLPLGAAFLGLDRFHGERCGKWGSVLLTGTAALLVFGALEVAEGHAALPLSALLAVLPLAALAVTGSHLARRLAGRAGVRACAWTRIRVRRAAVLFVRRVRAAGRAALRAGRLASGERAPPVLA